MIREEDKIASIFTEFNPDLSSDKVFISRLQRRMDTIDLVKRQIEYKKRQTRVAVFVAAISGFVFGIITAIFYPFINSLITRFVLSIIGQTQIFVAYENVFVVGILALIMLILVYSVYDITLLLNKFYSKELITK